MLGFDQVLLLRSLDWQPMVSDDSELLHVHLFEPIEELRGAICDNILRLFEPSDPGSPYSRWMTANLPSKLAEFGERWSYITPCSLFDMIDELRGFIRGAILPLTGLLNDSISNIRSTAGASLCKLAKYGE